MIKCLLVISAAAVVSLPLLGAQHSSPLQIFDLYQEALNVQAGHRPHAPEYDWIVNSFERYKAASSSQRSSTQKQLIQRLRGLAQLDVDAQTQVIGELAYFAARLPDRTNAIDFIAKLEAFCPDFSAIRFVYSGPATESARKMGGLSDVLLAGMYLSPQPYPMDEEPRLFDKPYEISPWDATSLQALRITVRSTGAGVHTGRS